MQDYHEHAEKNKVRLIGEGPCQFCGANTKRGVHECVEWFNLGFEPLDYSQIENHRYRFLSVDAHTLQHPEIHGRWNNHFHLTRLHLIFEHHLNWTYQLSPRLSDCLNAYKSSHKNENLNPPEWLNRGLYTVGDVIENGKDQESCQQWIEKWAKETYNRLENHHKIVDIVAKSFLKM